MPKEFAKTFVKKIVDEKEFLTLRLKKIDKKQIVFLRKWLNACLSEFAWETEEEKA